MDALILIAEDAISGITAERGVQLAGDVNHENLPHLSIFNPAESVELLPHNQERVECRISLVLATKSESQESILLKVDALRDHIRSNPTLGGIVDYAYISDRAILEDPEEGRKEALLVVTTLRDRF